MQTFFKRSNFSSRGFTLIELLAVAAIIVLITAFVLFRQSKFNSSTLLRSLSYSVALSLRQAQTYGTASRESTTGSGMFGQSYGVHFAAAASGSYTLFVDLNANGRFDTNETVTTFQLGRGYAISNFCAAPSLAGPCSLDGSIQSLDIVFKRPSANVCVSTDTQSGVCAQGGSPAYSGAYVQVRSDSEPTATRGITVNLAGQISVGAVGS